MKRQNQALIFKVFSSLKKNKRQKHPKNYNTLVERFKSKLQLE